jgi:hypothetical protein
LHLPRLQVLRGRLAGAERRRLYYAELVSVSVADLLYFSYQTMLTRELTSLVSLDLEIVRVESATFEHCRCSTSCQCKVGKCSTAAAFCNSSSFKDPSFSSSPRDASNRVTSRDREMEIVAGDKFVIGALVSTIPRHGPKSRSKESKSTHKVGLILTLQIFSQILDHFLTAKIGVLRFKIPIQQHQDGPP